MASEKEPLLFLVHRIPFPPNKGDKIRSYHLLQFLAEHYRIYLAAFIDDPQDEQYRDKVSEYCVKSCLERLNPLLAKIKSLTGLVSNKALSIPYYHSSSMQQWVNEVVEQKQIKKVLIFSSPMAQFVEHLPDNILKIMDFVDIDSDKWKQYCKTHKGIMSWVYAREARQLFKYEKQIAQQFNASLFVSQQEAQLFKKLYPTVSEKVFGISNGVDTEYFSSSKAFVSPYKKHQKVLVFTGAMDYWANCDAVIWFAKKIYPALYQKDQNYRFYIVGSRPTEAVKALDAISGVMVTGRVEDVRPYIQYAQLAVAPLRIARGIQNKVLEAMSMGKAVVATPNAIEGIELPDNLKQTVSDTETGIRQHIIALADNNVRENIEKQSRQWIMEHYSWQSTLNPLLSILEGTKYESSAG